MLTGLKRLFAGRGRAAAVLEPAAHLATATTLILLLVQSCESAADERRQRALSYVHDYNSDPISSHRLVVANAWLQYRQQIDTINKGEGLSRPEIDEFAQHVIAEYDRDHPSKPATLAIQAVADFYDQAWICVHEKVCDRDIVLKYFTQGATDFWGANQAIIRDLRPSMAPHLGENLELLIREAGKK